MDNTGVLTLSEGLIVASGGLIGALAKDCLQDNTLELPFVQGKRLYLGFIGAALIGAFLGYVVDGSFLTALMAGYTGKSVLESLLLNGTEIKKARKEAVTKKIVKVNGAEKPAF